MAYDPYALLMGSEPDSAAMAQAYAAQLRGDRGLGLLGLATGNKVLTNIGNALIGGAQQGSTQLSQSAGERLKMAMERQKAAQENAYRQGMLGVQQGELKVKQQQADQDNWAAVPDASGGTVLYNRKTGEFKPMGPLGPGGGAGGLKLTDAQQKAYDAANRLFETLPIINQNLPSGPQGTWDALATGYDSGPLHIGSVVPKAFSSDQGQRYFSASENAAGALLRKESGASITKDEWDKLGKNYIPQPFDSAQVKQDKLHRLDAALETAITEAGPAAAPMLRQRAAQMRQQITSAAGMAPGGRGAAPMRHQGKDGKWYVYRDGGWEAE